LTAIPHIGAAESELDLRNKKSPSVSDFSLFPLSWLLSDQPSPGANSNARASSALSNTYRAQPFLGLQAAKRAVIEQLQNNRTVSRILLACLSHLF
jgi:hypothetical protein